jgi:hypothetical protein
LVLPLTPLLAESEGHVNRMREPYERIYRRCLATPIAADTYPAKMRTSDLDR